MWNGKAESVLFSFHIRVPRRHCVLPSVCFRRQILQFSFEALGYLAPERSTQLVSFNRERDAFLRAAQIGSSSRRLAGRIEPHISISGPDNPDQALLLGRCPAGHAGPDRDLTLPDHAASSAASSDAA